MIFKSGILFLGLILQTPQSLYEFATTDVRGMPLFLRNFEGSVAVVVVVNDLKKSESDLAALRKLKAKYPAMKFQPILAPTIDMKKTDLVTLQKNSTSDLTGNPLLKFLLGGQAYDGTSKFLVNRHGQVIYRWKEKESLASKANQKRIEAAILNPN